MIRHTLTVDHGPDYGVHVYEFTSEGTPKYWKSRLMRQLPYSMPIMQGAFAFDKREVAP